MKTLRNISLIILTIFLILNNITYEFSEFCEEYDKRGIIFFPKKLKCLFSSTYRDELLSKDIVNFTKLVEKLKVDNFGELYFESGKKPENAKKYVEITSIYYEKIYAIFGTVKIKNCTIDINNFDDITRGVIFCPDEGSLNEGFEFLLSEIKLTERPTIPFKIVRAFLRYDERLQPTFK